MKTDPDDCAYPVEDSSRWSNGLTKRELFAAMAMQGMMSQDIEDMEDAANYAVHAADSLIDALNQEP